MGSGMQQVTTELRGRRPSDGLDLFVDALERKAGESLRGVFCGDFETREYRTLYADERTIEQYSAENVEEIVDDIALEQLGANRQESLYEPLGSLEVTVRIFEDGINVLGWGPEELPTVFVGLDGDVSNVLPATRLLRALFGD